MVVSGGDLRPATEEEVANLPVHDTDSWAPLPLPGLGKQGLAHLLAPGGVAAEGLLITCSCGHLFLDERF